MAKRKNRSNRPRPDKPDKPTEAVRASDTSDSDTSDTSDTSDPASRADKAGNAVAANKTTADNADSADSADKANKADSAGKADKASKADSADSKADSGKAGKADTAQASKADSAVSKADSADKTDSGKANKADTAQASKADSADRKADSADKTDSGKANKADTAKASKASKAEVAKASKADAKAGKGHQGGQPPAKAGQPTKPGPRYNPHRRSFGARPLPEARLTKGTGPREPVFWFGFEVTWTKLVRFRIVVFALLALDALLQFRHAPRYGAGNFNVGQLPLLDELGAGRVGYGAGQLIIAYLLVLAVFGVATRFVVPLAALLYAWLYFGSQLDSYQHHYLVAITLVLASFVPWQRPADATPDTPVRSWALRVLLIQLAIMYLWAAISKVDAAWIDGSTLGGQLTGTLKAVVEKTVGFKVASIAVIAVEATLAGTIWNKRTWFVAAPLGIVFHLGIVASGLEIGLFAYLMVVLYILVVPDRVWLWIDRYSVFRMIGRRLVSVAWSGWTTIGASLVIGIVVALFTRFQDAFAVAVAVSVIPLVTAFRELQGGRAPSAMIGIAHVAALLTWQVVDRTSTVAVDYYKFWGGSQRRLDNKETAERAYRRFVDIAPDDANARFQLGRLLLVIGDAEGLEQLHEAQRLEPTKARAFTEEARWLAKQSRTQEALEVAKRGVTADPNSSDARAFVDSLTRGARPPNPEPDLKLDSDP